MTSRDFCFWLNGFFELHQGTDELTAVQANCIRAHLALAFKHDIDPSMGDSDYQVVLNAIHDGPKKIRC